LLDQPIMIFHVSTAEGAQAIRDGAWRRPQGLRRDLPAISLPDEARSRQARLRGRQMDVLAAAARGADQDALWQALALGDIQTVSSDHAPYRFDETGKLSAGPNPNFKQIANGLPGLETRLPLLFDALVSKGRPEFAGRGIEAFVDLTATAPAEIYNLPGKGAIQPGYDADIAIWDPTSEVTISDEADA
jgi:dihydropyrimidinase